jgi:hypothetical protein
MVTDSCFLQGWGSARIYVLFSVFRGLSGGAARGQGFGFTPEKSSDRLLFLPVA